MCSKDFWSQVNQNISFNAFKNAMNNTNMTEQDIKKLFNIFDTDGDGLLNVSNKYKKNEVEALFNATKKGVVSNVGLTIEKNASNIQNNESKSKNLNINPLNTLSKEELKNLTINIISGNVQNAKTIYNNQVDNNGYVNDFVNGVKESLDTQFASSRVNRYLLNEENKVKLLTLANGGQLSKKDYFEAKINFIISILLPTLNSTKGNNSNEEKRDLKLNIELLKNELEKLTPIEIEKVISSIVMLSKEEYLEKAPIVTNNLIKNAKNKLENKNIEKNEEITVSGSIKDMHKTKEIYEKMSFEDTFISEYGVEYNPNNIKEFQEKDKTYLKFHILNKN